ncbi:MAG: DUF4159 domain-containing protein [Gemmatimonadales bacterium]
MDGYLPNVPYDGRFTFVRIKYTPSNGGFGFRRDVKWDHDYNRAELHFTKILEDLTTIGPRMDASNILAFDDPELFKYPVAYVSEPGYWAPTEKEVEGARNYLLKGGFIIFDDFAGNDIYNLETQMRRVLPEARIMPVGLEHPIWDSFYRIESLDYEHPYYRVPSVFLGIFENNDPTKRLMAVINYNNDVGEYWEWSDTGQFGIDLSNQAYKIGVNYIIYALTR